MRNLLAGAALWAAPLSLWYEMAKFLLILICAGICFWFVIRLLLPSVWEVDIKPLIERMLGPRR